MSFDGEDNQGGDDGNTRPSELRQWPVQLHLVSPMAPYFQSADVLLAADCVAYAAGDFHKDFLKGKGLAIACPKLDDGQDVYVAKLRALIDEAKINTLTVAIMQVPCCSGLLAIARQALDGAERPPQATPEAVAGALIATIEGAFHLHRAAPDTLPAGQMGALICQMARGLLVEILP